MFYYLLTIKVSHAAQPKQHQQPPSTLKHTNPTAQDKTGLHQHHHITHFDTQHTQYHTKTNQKGK